MNSVDEAVGRAVHAASFRRKGRGRLRRSGDATERPDRLRVARIAQTIAQKERRVVLCRPLLGIGPNPSTKDAELIAFTVGEYHPRRVTLPDIGPPSTEGKETFDFCGLIDRTKVKMESVLACLLLRNRHEQQARHPIRSRPDLELVRGVAHDNPAQGLSPPSTKRDRIVSVDDDLLPNEIHVAHSATTVSQADRHPGFGSSARVSDVLRSWNG